MWKWIKNLFEDEEEQKRSLDHNMYMQAYRIEFTKYSKIRFRWMEKSAGFHQDLLLKYQFTFPATRRETGMDVDDAYAYHGMDYPNDDLC